VKEKQHDGTTDLEQKKDVEKLSETDLFFFKQVKDPRYTLIFSLIKHDPSVARSLSEFEEQESSKKLAFVFCFQTTNKKFRNWARSEPRLL
jgi:hypothetical protein